MGSDPAQTPAIYTGPKSVRGSTGICIPSRQITTMPEGGSLYPLPLVFAPDDGSVAPGAPGSPVY